MNNSELMNDKQLHILEGLTAIYSTMHNSTVEGTQNMMRLIAEDFTTFDEVTALKYGIYSMIKHDAGEVILSRQYERTFDRILKRIK